MYSKDRIPGPHIGSRLTPRAMYICEYWQDIGTDIIIDKDM